MNLIVRYAHSMGRRADGELERDVLNVLWDVEEALQPSDVREALGADLAYTSVATVLTRLVEKGTVTRVPMGRAFAYRPTLSREDWYAEQMLAVVDGSPNQRALLVGFVGKLSRRDREALRRMLAENDRR